MPRRSVALLIETSNAYARGLLAGVAEYVRQHEQWAIYLPEQQRGGKPPQWLSRWQGDGVIARIETAEIAAVVRRLKAPVVDVSAARHLPELPWVETDDAAIAQLGVTHLAERGFRNLAFCGDPGFNWSNWRKQHFLELTAEAGLNAYVFDALPQAGSRYSWSREKRGLAAWLKKLPRPVGILACYDIQARKLLEICREMDIAVPEEVAVLGVDNDSVLCELADPPLSSVACDTSRTGFEAASLLDRMMSGETIQSSAVLVKPQGVCTRQSTDVLAVSDGAVASALRYIRENAFLGINVSDVVSATALSRRVLETRFRKALGRTPHEEITRLKVNRIQELLSQTDLSLFEIADRTGFEHEEYMSVFFKKATGLPPGKYRNSKRKR